MEQSVHRPLSQSLVRLDRRVKRQPVNEAPQIRFAELLRPVVTA